MSGCRLYRSYSVEIDKVVGDSKIMKPTIFHSRCFTPFGPLKYYYTYLGSPIMIRSNSTLRFWSPGALT